MTENGMLIDELEGLNEPGLIDEILSLAQAAEETGNELELIGVPSKSAKRLAKLIEALAEDAEEEEKKRAASRLRALAEKVAQAPDADLAELAGKLRVIASELPEALKVRAERIAAKMEKKALAEYGYAYPEPQKKSSDDLEALTQRVNELSAQMGEFASALTTISQLNERLAELSAQLEGLAQGLAEVQSKQAVAVPALTTEQPAFVPPARLLVEAIKGGRM